MPPPADILKVAIEWPGAFPKLMEIDQKKPLSAIIKEVCDGWQLPNPETYALQNGDSTNFYITEKNRNNIKNGSILCLTTSPAQMALQLHDRIQSGSLDMKLDALKELANSSRDITFAQEFINLDGISLLTQMVESGTDYAYATELQLLSHTARPTDLYCYFMKECSFKIGDYRAAAARLCEKGFEVLKAESIHSKRHHEALEPVCGSSSFMALDMELVACDLVSCSFGEILSYTLTAFVELMDHGIISWDTFSVAFIKKIASFVCKSSTDSAVLQRSLAILESMVLNSQDLYQKVAQEITIGQLMPHLQGTDQDIQTYTIAVINALFLKAPEDKRQEMAHILAQKQLRYIILSSVIRSNKPINDEMAHQLYMLQVLTFNLLEDRMMTKMDPQDQAQRDIIFELRRIAFDVESESNSGSIEKRKSMYTRDYKKLGFINHVNPAVDFTQIPPGMLALDNMLYFAKNHQDSYIRIVLENSSREDKHECPFGRSSIELTKMLCEILKVGELPSENCHDFHPMFFTNDHSFEEFFCICIQLLNKTWKEMRATSEDFNKVMQVVREQITRALTNKPNSLDQFKTRLQNLSYTEILKIRQSERMNQEDFQSRPILELREKIQPEIMELIKQQRLNRLCEGTCFRKISSRRRQVPVADIKAVVTGKDCPHMKEKGALKQKEVLELAFSILYESDEYLNFIAPDKHEYCVWTDGLNALLGKEMTSEFTRSDLDTLLNMEMKLRLLDLENIQIPEAPPPIPKEPSNYDFVYDCN
ncbi:Engulfment and cell motility protein 1 [Bagarius yarrelli]|uniref:Engulfment and cell motility protein 1 n=1 Tax=Bagarius yarrelli TaxID=175774 RepID=A0A556TPL1_BAGYA|nr:Engulfment and cell motility protein 1 [Bagarius yarrelli]